MRSNLDAFLDTFTYDPETGIFLRDGTQRGSMDGKGYIRLTLGHKAYWFAHRIAFAFMGHEIPEYVDHHNGIRNDNRWTNLRPATWAQNQHNKRMRRDNTSGIKGVSWHKDRRKWQVSIMVNKKQIYFGLFTDLAEAEKVAREAREKLHKDFCKHD